MSLRIRTKGDLAKLSSGAKAQIKIKAPKALVSKKQSRVSTTGEGLKYCIYPSSDPAVWLHNALVNEFGSMLLHENGEIAHEVMIDGCEKAFRYDHIHIPTRTAIEFDGWRNHSNLVSFQTDREKDRQAMLQNFLVYRTTNQSVRKDLAKVICDIKQIVNQRHRYEDDRLETVGNTFLKVYKAKAIKGE
jgi:hypothetical protein